MLYRLLTTTAVVLALSSPAFAGSTDGTLLAQAQTEQPAQPDAGMQAPETGMQAPETGMQEPAPAPQTAPETATEAPTEIQPPASTETETAQPSPGAEQGIIDAQAPDEWRADSVIGMGVTNTGEDSLGKVSDLVFAADGKVRAIVLSVGGFLGVGSKLVALPWDAVEVDEEQDLVFVRLSKEELEAAPEFRTKEQVLAEEEALMRQQEQEQQQLQQQVPPAPATE